MQIQGSSSIYGSYADNTLQLSSSFKKISSGVQSNTDSPSGVAISERLRSEVLSQAVALQNVDAAISTVQTADAWLQNTGNMLGRMKELSVEYKSGTLSEADKANIETEFSSVQGEISRVSSEYTAAAKFNGLYLLRGGNGQPVAEGDSVGQGQMTVQNGPGVDQKTSLNMSNLSTSNTQIIGTVNRYEYDASNNVIASSHTTVTWEDITQMDISDESAVAKIDAATDFVASALVSDAVTQRELESTRESLMSSQSNLRKSESNIRDVDEAFASTQLAKEKILSTSGTMMLKQGNELNIALLYKLLGG
ncbi:MAG: hypothetical protein A2017_02125 [Lentisphaerae bacterium GWF2_44_16]|nr:MAG: hypothetical protein A2017_02125 [Lentisphaerae bacterium GWF2_44_16]